MIQAAVRMAADEVKAYALVRIWYHEVSACCAPKRLPQHKTDTESQFLGSGDPGFSGSGTVICRTSRHVRDEIFQSFRGFRKAILECIVHTPFRNTNG